MKNIVLAAGYATRLYPLTEHFPKPLLAVGGSTILERLIDDIDSIAGVDEHIIVSNHKFIETFRAWAEERKTLKPIRVVDDGTETNASRLGAVRDLLLALESCSIDEDILVVAADNLLDFSLSSFVDFFKAKGSSVVMCYYEPELRLLQRMGVVVLDDEQRVTDMQEKPLEPASHWATPPFYIYRKGDLPLIRESIDNGCSTDAPGHLAHYLFSRTALYAYPIPGRRYDIGTLESYEAVRKMFAER